MTIYVLAENDLRSDAGIFKSFVSMVSEALDFPSLHLTTFEDSTDGEPLTLSLHSDDGVDYWGTLQQERYNSRWEASYSTRASSRTIGYSARAVGLQEAKLLFLTLVRRATHWRVDDQDTPKRLLELDEAVRQDRL